MFCQDKLEIWQLPCCLALCRCSCWAFSRPKGQGPFDFDAPGKFEIEKEGGVSYPTALGIFTNGQFP